MAIIITGVQWGDEGKTKFSHYKSLQTAIIMRNVEQIKEQCAIEGKNRIIGVMKAYTTQTGSKAFPTEETDKVEETMRQLGHEYDLVTGEARRCGWLDAVSIRRVIREKGIAELAISHIDTIGKIAQATGIIRVCTRYWNKHMLVRDAPDDLEYCRPCYETFCGGWEVQDCKEWEDLHERAKYLIEHIEHQVGIPIKYIGIGPDDNQVIIRP